MAKSLKANYIFNLINSLSSLLFPLLTFPYASRIIEADGIGQVEFFSSIISYVSVFTSLGIPIYAIREVAKARDNITEMNKVTIEILLLHGLLTVIAYIIIGVLSFSIQRIQSEIPLFLLLSLTIFFSAIGCDWFYQGLEEFKYITLRNLFVKIVGVILLYTIVKQKSDLFWYAAIIVLGTVGNNIFNVIRLRHFLHLSLIKLNDIKPFRHILPVMKVFALNMTISIYTNLDVVFLGFLSSAHSVGYYTSANKILRLLLSFIGTLQTTLLPRASSLATSVNNNDFIRLYQKAFDFVFFISMPMVVGVFFMAPTLIVLICGQGFIPAVSTLQIMSPLVLIIAFGGIVCYLILYPLHKENIAISATMLGAVANAFCNILFIPRWGHDGAAFAILIAESMVTLSLFYIGKKYIKAKLLNIHCFNCFLGSVFMGFILLIMNYLDFSFYYIVFLYPLTGCLIYLSFLYFRKDDFLLYIVELIKYKIK